ncbi:MAG: SDR family NAD(P)-dependent oxidoreductase [Planctomycetota bacterium]
MQKLEGRTALVTGASAGIGAATTRALVRAGAHVVAAARRGERLAALVEELGSNVTPLVLDVRAADSVQKALAGDAFDLVVANAGLGRGVDPLQSGDVEGWHEMIDTNIKGVLHVVRATLAGMLARGHGDVVLIGSVAGRQVYPGGNVYNATKHAVKALYEALRLDAGGRGVRFTTVDPGMVETEFSEVRFGGDRERARAVYQGFTPLQPDDVADAILFAVTRPPHVNVGELVLWPTDQASTTIVRRDAPIA